VTLKGCNTPVISVSHNKNVFTIVPGLLLKVTTTPGSDGMEGGSVKRTDQPTRSVHRSAGSSKRDRPFSGNDYSITGRGSPSDSSQQIWHQ